MGKTVQHRDVNAHLVDRARRVNLSSYDHVYACDGSFVNRTGGWSMASSRGHLLVGTLPKVKDAGSCELMAFLTALDHASDTDGRKLVVTDCLGLARLQELGWSKRESFLMSLGGRFPTPTLEERVNGLDRWRVMGDSVDVLHLKAHQGYDHTNLAEVLHSLTDRASREAAAGRGRDQSLQEALGQMGLADLLDQSAA